MSVSRYHKGLSLIEVLIVVSLIATMMALSLPMLSSANAQARAAVCRQNLIDMAGTIASYAQDHNTLPAVYELPPHHEGLSLPELVSPRLQTPNVVFCPSDETEQSQLLGTSYRWASAFNDRPLEDLDHALQQSLLFDRQAFHSASARPVNELVLSSVAEGFILSVPGADEDQGTPNQQPTTIYFERDHQDWYRRARERWRDRWRRDWRDWRNDDDDDD